MDISVTHIETAHEDERRSLTAIFNDDFNAKQVKVIRVKETSELGNHYHHYGELFYVLEGHCYYTFVDVNTDERQLIHLNKGDRIIIGPMIAHKAIIDGGTITLEATEEPYVSADVNDVRYEITEE